MELNLQKRRIKILTSSIISHIFLLFIYFYLCISYSKEKKRKPRNKHPDQDISFSLSSSEDSENKAENNVTQKSKKKKNRRRRKSDSKFEKNSHNNSGPINNRSEDVASTSNKPASRNSTPVIMEETRNTSTKRDV